MSRVPAAGPRRPRADRSPPLTWRGGPAQRRAGRCGAPFDVGPPVRQGPGDPSAGAWGQPGAQVRRPGGLGLEVGQDAADVLRDAVAAGRDTVTVVVRTAAKQEGDVAYGRTYGGHTGINAKVNTAPDLPTNVRLGTWLSREACGEKELTVSFADWNPLTVYADVSDPDGTTGLVARAMFWPAGDPATRQDATATVFGSWTEVVAPQELFVDGGTYVMQLRTEDTDGAASPWTSPCRFTVDQTAS